MYTGVGDGVGIEVGVGVGVTVGFAVSVGFFPVVSAVVELETDGVLLGSVTASVIPGCHSQADIRHNPKAITNTSGINFFVIQFSPKKTLGINKGLKRIVI